MAEKKPKVKLDKETISGAVNGMSAKAEEYAGDTSKSSRLLEAAWAKAQEYATNPGALSDVWQYLTALLRLLQAYIRQDYREIPWKSLVMVIVAILYFVSPVDLVPDMVPVAGFVDDAAVITFVVGQITADLDAFMAWEAQQQII